MRLFLSVLIVIGIQSCRKDVPKSELNAMLGDSMTRRGNWSALLHKTTTNFGIDGLKTTGLLNNVLPQALQRNPDFVYLMIGFNNANTLSFKSDIYEADLVAICDTLETHRIPFLVQSVLPPTLSCTQTIDPVLLKQNVDQLNVFLADFCAKRKILFIDLRPVLTDKNGYLDERYSTDGVHLNQLGYQVWAAMLL